MLASLYNFNKGKPTAASFPLSSFQL